jgi:hypothetical protein
MPKLPSAMDHWLYYAILPRSARKRPAYGHVLSILLSRVSCQKKAPSVLHLHHPPTGRLHFSVPLNCCFPRCNKCNKSKAVICPLHSVSYWQWYLSLTMFVLVIQRVHNPHKITATSLFKQTSD